MCVMAASGQVVRAASVDTAPGAVAEAIAAAGGQVERVGMEAGPRSSFLARELAALRVPIVVIDVAHAAAVLRTGFRSKTDERRRARPRRPNADGQAPRRLGRVVRRDARPSLVGGARAARADSRSTRAARSGPSCKARGLRPSGLSNPAFRRRLAERLDDPEIGPLLEPLAAVVEHLDRQVTALDRAIAAKKASPACRRPMSVPGAGPLVALTHTAGVDDPGRGRSARTVGAHLGLTPRRFQSGETDWSGRISRGLRRRGATGAPSGGQRPRPRHQGQVARRGRGPCASRGGAAWPRPGGARAQARGHAAQAPDVGREPPGQGRAVPFPFSDAITVLDRSRVPPGPSGDGAGMSATSPSAPRLSCAGI